MRVTEILLKVGQVVELISLNYYKDWV